jgi:hypothetical protein
VTADTKLPPLSVKSKFVLATRDSFDYSSFTLAAIIAGENDGSRETPEFGHGAAAYARYFWHSAADLGVGNYFTEFIVPTLTHEDPRYYALGHGGFLHRTGYALSRCVITRTDSGNRTLNVSELLGNGVASAVTDFYYPPRERTWRQTRQKWALQLGVDALFDFGMEFWPDIDRHVFHNRF